MRLKYITLCLLGLSISGCAQHVIKTNQSDQTLAQQASHGLNAMFENASYDMKGQFSIQTDIQFESEQAETKPQALAEKKSELDPQLKKQLDQLIKTQNIPFSQKEKKQLYQALANESTSPSEYYDEEGESSSPQSNITQSLVNVLNDLQFSYSGSVHFRQKLAALTLQLSYQKPTLQVNAQLPMVVDFNEHKFYTNYFAFMPFMVNRESQGSLAYVDFSKHKATLEQIDLKKFADYLKQMNVVPYALAEPNQLQTVGLTRTEKDAGIVKKIRFIGDMETLQTQLELFDYVNEIYYTEQIKGEKYVDSAAATASAAAAASVAEAYATAAAAEVDLNEDEIDAAYSSVERVNEVVNTKMQSLTYHEQADNTESEYAATEDEVDAESAYAAAATSDGDESYRDDEIEAYATEEDESESAARLSEEICQALIKTKHVPIGKVTLCRDYQDLRVIPVNTAFTAEPTLEAEAAEDQESADAVAQLKPIFQQYQSEQRVDAQQFKQLWQKHQREISQALNATDKASSSFVADIGLDRKGRVQNMDYSLAFSDPRVGKINLKSTNQILNYGNATAIDRQALKQAKSIEEVSKGSLFENMVKGFLSPITGQDPYAEEAETSSVDDQQNSVELPEYLSTVAAQSYQRHHSELKAYQATFAVAFAAYRPEYVKYYSASELNEIAEVYAYQFLDNLEQPKGNALKRLNQLREKHTLKGDDDFDDLGSSVKHYMQEGIGKIKAQHEFKQLLKTYKTKQAVFAQLYQQKYLAMYDVEDVEKVELAKAAKVYAKAFVDDTQGKLSEASVNGLTAAHEDLFSQPAYYETYKIVQKHMK